MTEKTWRRVTGWAGVLLGLLALVLLLDRLGWLIDPVLATVTPFVIAFIIALILNPLITRLEQRGTRRLFSVGLTSLLFLVLFAGAVLLLVPRLIEQGTDLARNMPTYAKEAEESANALLNRAKPLLERANLPTTLPGFADRFPQQIRGFSASAISAVSGFLMNAASRLTWLFVVPLVTIWLLMNWNAQSDKFSRLLPDEHRDRILHVLGAVGTVLNSYVRGIFVLAILYGAFTAFILGVFFRMPYALVLGLVAGLVSPIPYIGSIVILISTGVVAFATNPSLGYVLAVLAAMVVQNNVLFDNVIAPRVLGGSVGLSLPWSLFALMLGGSLFGIAGMILAVPVGATINVLLMELVPKLREQTPEQPNESEAPPPTRQRRRSTTPRKPKEEQ